MFRITTALISLSLLVTSCADFNNPYPSNSSYGSPYGSAYGSNRDYEYERDLERERRKVDRERDRLEDERRALEEERRRAYTPPPPPPVHRAPESCPPGFSPSENKCSKEERRRGCQDMRLPGGLGCVRR